MKKFWRKLLKWIIYVHYGKEHPFCKHTNVDVKTANASTGQPITGVCKICKKEVKAILVWEEK